MKTMACVCILLFLELLSSDASAKLSAIVGGTLISPGMTRPLEDSVLLLDGNKIIKVGKAQDTKVPEGVEKIRADGKWIIPGLTDGHVHFFQSGGLYARPDVIDLRRFRPYAEEIAWVKENLGDTFDRYIRSGVTSVVDMGGPLWNFEVRSRAAKTGAAPRVRTSGPLIATWRPDELAVEDPPIIKVNSSAEAEAEVKRQAAFKPDLIKIWFIVPPGRDPEDFHLLVKAAIEESHRRGIRVSVHATQLETARPAVKLGADILAHSVQDREVDKEFIELLKERKVIYIPTLIVSLRYREVFSQRIQLTPPETRIANPLVLSSLHDLTKLPSEGIPESIRRRIEQGGQPMADPVSLKNLKLLHDAGVIIAAGTDAGNIGTPHGPAIFRELELMRQAGLSPEEILTTATLNGAKLTATQNGAGTLEAGKTADMVILNSSPLADIGNTSDIHAVIKDGEVVYREKS